MTKLGGTLTKTLTPVAAGIGLAGKRAFDDWHAGMKAIRAGTGATGKDLDALEGVMKRVGGRVTAPLADVGQVVADLNTRLGLTGKPLEEMAKKFLDLKRLGFDVDVASMTRLFGDWSVKTEDQSETMDQLFRVSQATGIGLGELSQMMVQFGSPLRQMGFDMETAAVMFSKFEKEGVNIQTAMPGLRMALKNFAKEGKDPVEALSAIISQIKNAATTAEANTLAFQIFGTRAGPDLAAAIREGRFDFDELIDTMKNGKDTIASAADETLTLGDKMKMLKNRVFASIGPYGEFVAIVGAGVAAIGPALMGIGLMAPALGKMSGALRTTAAAQWLMNTAMLGFPLFWIIGALIALGVGLMLAWKHSETFRRIVTGAWDAVRSAAGAVAIFFRDHVWPVISRILDLLQKHPAWLLIRAAINHIDDAVGAVRASFVWLRENGGRAIDVFWSKAGPAFGKLKDVVEAIVSALGKMVDGIKWLGDKGAGILGKVGSIVGKIPGIGDAGDPNFTPFPTPSAHPNTGISLRGARPEMFPFAATGAALGLQVTSGLRPGARTRSGTLSDHALGKALDLSNGYNTPQMAAFFRSLIGNPRVKQAFYDPLGSIFGGAWSSYREGGHSDHVHVATYDLGGWLMPGLTLALNATGTPERISPPGGDAPALHVEHMHVRDERDADLVAARVWQRLATR